MLRSVTDGTCHHVCHRGHGDSLGTAPGLSPPLFGVRVARDIPTGRCCAGPKCCPISHLGLAAPSPWPSFCLPLLAHPVF